MPPLNLKIRATNVDTARDRIIMANLARLSLYVNSGIATMAPRKKDETVSMGISQARLYIRVFLITSGH